MKNLFYIVSICIILLSLGCEKSSTYIEQQLLVPDQNFSLSEKSKMGTLVGKVEVSNPNMVKLHYFLVSGNYSKAFYLEDSTGRLFLEDTTAINYNNVQQIDLEVMVSYSDSIKKFGLFANIDILITDVLDTITWISNNSSKGNQDAMVNSLNPTLNYGQSFYNLLSAWTVNLHPSILRSFLQFDLTAIPKNTSIVNAKLKLYNPNDSIPDHRQSTLSGSNDFLIQRISTAWDSETLTWNNQPNYTTDGQALTAASESGNQNFVIDVTEMVKEMISNPTSNFGFVMMLNNENYYRRICFASLKHPNEDIRPKLEITYLK